MSDFERVKSSVDIVSYIQSNVSLKKTGKDYKALCPFHPEKTPSFTVNPQTQQWKCWGACGVGGSVIDFAMKFHHMTELEALQEVARFAGITLEPLSPEHKVKQDKRERLYALMEAAVKFFQKHLYDNDDALDYLYGTRKLSLETIEHAQIGYAPFEWQRLIPYLKSCGYTEQEMIDSGMSKRNKEDNLYDTFRNRLMIPIRDHKGRIVAFSGRAMDKKDEPKYLHNENNATTGIFEKSKIIHRMPLNQSTIGFKASDVIVMVEGSIDPVSALNCGVYNIASLLGKSLSDEQLTLLCKTGAKRLVFCLDKDDAGRKALRNLTEKHITRLASQGIELYAMFAPHGKDPDDTFREMPHLWQPAVDAAQSVVSVLIDLEIATLGANATAAEKSKLARDLLPILKSDNPFVEEENLKTLADKIGIPYQELKAWAHPYLHIMPKFAPVAVQPLQEIPLEIAILRGILVNEDHHWLARANAVLNCLAPVERELPYALGPLTAADFTHGDYKQLMTMIVEDHAGMDERIRKTPLFDVYYRITVKPLLTSAFEADTPINQAQDSYEEFIGKVLRLRLNRLKVDMKQGKNVREAMQGIALIQQKRES